MAALLVGMSVMAVMMAAALPVWTHVAQREKEEELIWRGEQYRRAIMLFQRRYANTFPPTLDVLVEQKFLRKKYKDPIANDDFQIIPVGGAMPGGRPGMPATGGPANVPGGQGGAGGFGAAQPGTPAGAATSSSFGQATQPAMGIQGVTSKSKDQSIKLYNGMDRYNQWAFVYLAASTQAGAGGAGFVQPGMRGRPPGAGGPPGGGFGQPGGGFGPPGGGFGQPGGGFGQPGGGFGQPGGGFGQPGVPAQPKYPPVPGGAGSPGGFGAPGGGVPPAGPGGSVFTPGTPGSGGQ